MATNTRTPAKPSVAGNVLNTHAQAADRALQALAKVDLSATAAPLEALAGSAHETASPALNAIFAEFKASNAHLCHVEDDLSGDFKVENNPIFQAARDRDNAAIAALINYQPMSADDYRAIAKFIVNDPDASGFVQWGEGEGAAIFRLLSAWAGAGSGPLAIPPVDIETASPAPRIHQLIKAHRDLDDEINRLVDLGSNAEDDSEVPEDFSDRIKALEPERALAAARLVAYVRQSKSDYDSRVFWEHRRVMGERHGDDYENEIAILHEMRWALFAPIADHVAAIDSKAQVPAPETSVAIGNVSGLPIKAAPATLTEAITSHVVAAGNLLGAQEMMNAIDERASKSNIASEDVPGFDQISELYWKAVRSEYWAAFDIVHFVRAGGGDAVEAEDKALSEWQQTLKPLNVHHNLSEVWNMESSAYDILKASRDGNVATDYSTLIANLTKANSVLNGPVEDGVVEDEFVKTACENAEKAFWALAEAPVRNLQDVKAKVAGLRNSGRDLDEFFDGHPDENAISRLVKGLLDID